MIVIIGVIIGLIPFYHHITQPIEFSLEWRWDFSHLIHVSAFWFSTIVFTHYSLLLAGIYLLTYGVALVWRFLALSHSPTLPTTSNSSLARSTRSDGSHG